MCFVQVVVEEPKTLVSQIDNVHLEVGSGQASRFDVAVMGSKLYLSQRPETGLERRTIGSGLQSWRSYLSVIERNSLSFEFSAVVVEGLRLGNLDVYVLAEIS
jgi:hypothetical protein